VKLVVQTVQCPQCENRWPWVHRTLHAELPQCPFCAESVGIPVSPAPAFGVPKATVLAGRLAGMS
jgi:NAD-dependent SIR2 family protein deacetylase